LEYSFDEKVLIWLSSFDCVSVAKHHALLELFKTPTQIFASICKRDINAVKILQPHFEQVFEKANQNHIDAFVKNLASQNIVCSTIISKNYPQPLAQTYHCPINLFLKGDVSLLSTRCIAIVGTRTPSGYGKSVTMDFAKTLAQNGLTIVSGLAMGVDKIAHEAALEVGGKTIAVLGSGFGRIYPAMNTNLANTIAVKGLLVSEYAPAITPQKYTFPARNRIVAGLCEGVLLTEAGSQSGTLYTKEYAVEFNRNVYAVPGNITSSLSAGTNRLIQSCQASCVLDSKDILQDMGIKPVEKRKIEQLTVEEQIILNFVEKEQLHYEEILAKTKFEPKTLTSCLTSMAIRGIIKKLPGNYYTK
jgi:DNA processing protein